MGAEELNVNPTQISRVGSQVQDSHQSLRTLISDFEQRLASYGELGGIDTLSSIAKMLSAEIKKVAFESLPGNNTNLGDHGDRYSAMSAGYQYGEQKSTQDVTTAI
jgi:hypothetical protein